MKSEKMSICMYVYYVCSMYIIIFLCLVVVSSQHHLNVKKSNSENLYSLQMCKELDSLKKLLEFLCKYLLVIISF